MRRDRRVVGVLAACGALLSVPLGGCAQVKVTPPRIAPDVEHVSVVVIGGQRAEGPGRRGAGYPTNWAQQFYRSAVAEQATMVDLGRAGFEAADAAELADDLQRLRPTLAVVWVGDDEALRRIAVDRFERDVRSLLDRLAAAGVTRILLAIPPAWNDRGLSAAEVAPYDDAVRAAAGPRAGVTLVDLTAVSGAPVDDEDGIAAAFVKALRG